MTTCQVCGKYICFLSSLNNPKKNNCIFWLIVVNFIVLEKENGAAKMSKDANPIHDMVQNQIIRRGVKDPKVIEAMLTVERHLFVQPEDQHLAYSDHPIPIGQGQTISQPYMVALMTEVLLLAYPMSVLEIGTGSGYQTAILAKMAKNVYSIERISELSQRARKILDYCHYDNVQMKVGDGSLGWQELAPFDRVIVTAGGTKIPPPLVQQLDMDGILVIPVGERSLQTLYQVHKVARLKEGQCQSSNKKLLTKLGLSLDDEDYDLEIRSIEYCMFVPLIGEYA